MNKGVGMILVVRSLPFLHNGGKSWDVDSKVSDIPVRAYSRMERVRCDVSHVDGNNVVVYHRAPLASGVRDPLHVRLFGVEQLASQAHNWIAENVKDQTVSATLVCPPDAKNDLKATVILQSPVPSASLLRRLWLTSPSVSEELVRIGAATATGALDPVLLYGPEDAPAWSKSNRAILMQHAQAIESAQATAKRKGLGIWYGHEPKSLARRLIDAALSLFSRR